jgi:hypothetical protein
MLTPEERAFRERMYAMELLEKTYIDPKQKLEHPPVALSYGTHSYNTKEGMMTYDTPIGTYGNFSFLQAPPKHKKTFLVTLLSAAYIGGADGFTGRLKGHRDGRCILHFDTEQGAFHAQRVFKRTLDMCGVEDGCYRTYGLRELSAKQRADVIRVGIEDTPNVGMVIIDGIADLVTDVNNIEESNAIVQMIMSLTHEHNIHIVTVIHTNFNTNKPTGHLGSAMEKKAETQIQLERDANNENIILVKCKSSRNKSFDDFSFYVNDYGFPQIADANLDWISILTYDSKIKHTNNPHASPIG